MYSNKPQISFSTQSQMPCEATHLFTDGKYDTEDNYDDYPKPVSGSIADDEDNAIGFYI